MKKNILILSFILISITSFGQDFVPTQKMLNINNFTNRFNTVQDNGLPMVLNVKFHGVHETDGSDLHNINEERFLKIVASLNTNFNQFNIFFKYRGYSYINNSTYVANPPASTGPTIAAFFADLVTQQGNYDENAINIFIFNGYSQQFGNNMLLSTILHQDANSIDGVSPFYDYQVCKIMGLTLGLIGISGGGNGVNYNNVTNNIPSCITNPNGGLPFMKKANFFTSSITTENVARSGQYFNADWAGDMVVDTQALFMEFRFNFCNDNPNQKLQTFMQHPEVVDLTNTMYACTSVESHNFMLAYFNQGIPNSFTPGQGARMRQFIISNPTDFNPLLNLLDNGDSDISVLYEPFSMSGGSGGNGNTTTAYSKTYTTNTTNTGANVWNCGPFTMRFQTGFDCEFYPYNASTITQTPYQQLNYPTTTSISVKIPILGQQVYQNVAPVCFYSFEPFTSGDIKSLSNLGSGVYTQEQLDEIKASDPKLYEELQSGKYHIITKQTDSGFIDQKIIYKN